MPAAGGWPGGSMGVVGMSGACGKCGERFEGAAEDHRCETVLRTAHPQSTTALVLGILGLVLCFVLAPVAWVVGGRAVRAIDAEPARWEGRGPAQAGRVLGVVGTILSSVVIVGAAILVVVVGVLGDDVQDAFDDAADQLGTSDPTQTGSGGGDGTGSAATDSDRTSAIRFADEAAQTIVSVDFSAYDSEVEEAAALMSPSFAEEYRVTVEEIRTTFTEQRTKVQAKTVAAGLVGADRVSAQVLVFLNQSVDRQRDGEPETVVTPFKVLVDLERIDGSWLVSGIQTEGGQSGSGIREETDAERREVLDAARDLVRNFSNFDYQDPDTTIEAVLAGSTGDFAEAYRAESDGLRRLAREAKSTMTADVFAAGLVSLDEDSATVIVATTGSVTNKTTGFEPEARNHRIQVELVRTNGEWLVSDLQYVQLN